MDSISNLCLGPQTSTIRDNILTGMMMRKYSNKEFHSLQEFEAGELGGGFGNTGYPYWDLGSDVTDQDL